MPRGRSASRRSWPVLGARPEAFQGPGQALLVSESLTLVLAAAAAGIAPTLEDLRADFRSAMQADVDESFAVRMRQRYPPFVTPAPQAPATQPHQ